MIITSSDREEIIRLKQHLSKEFELKDLGKLRYFLRVEFARSKGRLIMSQKKYTLVLLKETGKIKCKPVTILVEANHKISIKDGMQLDEKRYKYERLVGKLIYFTLTRPDVTYVVNVVSQFINSPTDVNTRAAETILCNLKNSGEGCYLLNQKFFG